MQGTSLMGGRWLNGRPPARGVGGVADRGGAGAADTEGRLNIDHWTLNIDDDNGAGE